MIKIITTENEFKNLEKDWNELYQNAEVRTPFQSFAFVWSSWINFLNKQSKNKIWIVCYWEKSKKLTGLVPLYIDKKGILRFINDSHLDFGDGLFEKKEKNYFIIKNIIEFIEKDKNCKGLILSNLTHSSIIFPYFKSGLKESFAYATTEHSFLPIIEQNQIESSLHLRAKERNELAKANKLNAQHLHKIYRIETDPFPYKELVQIRNIMHSHGRRINTFFGDDFLNLSRDLYENKHMVVSITHNNNAITSASTIIADHGKKWYMFWVSMYDENYKLINVFNNNQFINSSIKDKENCIDFGRGGYDYKFRNYLPIVHNVYELVWSKTLVTTLKMFFIINLFYLKRILKPIIRKK
jgi:hypothetical protein